ncbi:tetratricopeptide repeat protein [Bremerella volcania]|nr:tetratricopeptide repeat protein [Bremerella volcania]
MLRIWKESDRVLWMLILLYLVIMTVAALPTLQRRAAANRPATLLEMAWAAEGNLSEADRAAAQQRLTRHLAWMENNLPAQWGRYSIQERAEWVFQSMHEHLLFGEYDENQNTLSKALLEGNYNCVSATILYQILTDRAGLPTVAMQTRGHVWCRLLSRPELDVETTCPTWFLLEPHDQGQSPAIQAADEARTLSARGLAAKIPYNKASLAAAQGDYSGAIEYLNFALSLDPQDAAAMRNRSAILNNWAVACIGEKDCQTALDILERMEAQRPHDPDLEGNRSKIVDAVIDQWCHQGRYSEALRLLQMQGDPSQSRHSVRSLYQAWIQDAASRGDWYEAKNALRLAISAHQDDPLTVAQLRRQYRQLISG